jgi:hypothetical protein
VVLTIDVKSHLIGSQPAVAVPHPHFDSVLDMIYGCQVLAL